MNPIYNAYIPKELAKRLLDKKFPLFKYEVNGYEGKPSFFEIKGLSDEIIKCFGHSVNCNKYDRNIN